MLILKQAPPRTWLVDVVRLLYSKDRCTEHPVFFVVRPLERFDCKWVEVVFHDESQPNVFNAYPANPLLEDVAEVDVSGRGVEQFLGEPFPDSPEFFHPQAFMNMNGLGLFGEILEKARLDAELLSRQGLVSLRLELIRALRLVGR